MLWCEIRAFILHCRWMSSSSIPICWKEYFHNPLKYLAWYLVKEPHKYTFLEFECIQYMSLFPPALHCFNYCNFIKLENKKLEILSFIFFQVCFCCSVFCKTWISYEFIWILGLPLSFLKWALGFSEGFLWFYGWLVTCGCTVSFIFSVLALNIESYL